MMGTVKDGPRGFSIVDDQEKPEPEAPAGRGQPPSHAAEALPSITFGTFVLSLSTSAMIHLGVAPPPGGGEKPERNLTLARQTIDILEMLHEKTRGNLEQEERRLLESVLHDLRMRFVEAGQRES